ncbi:Ser/Thr protein phosphatase protein [Artomyces pyxidatus]|uniref:Ser/Thr protein phosphatase protein n=1 Tax=Artomyces pyxidatus TaxID=48021 RepID=A0ACB8SX37_9AGAM|nr:Ser/Thr protein phosphatase protein [Artomyces pyxidatus]
MQIQIISDLHLEIERPGSEPGREFYHYNIPVRAEHLALLGDIGWTVEDRLFEWLEAQLKLFKTVFFVSGNHEPYRSSIEESYERLTAFATKVNADASLGTFVYLNRTRYDISPTLTILGCTLWSALDPADLDILSWSLTDFRRIDAFDPAAYATLHAADVAWLNAAVAAVEPGREVVVFTHHAPTKAGTGDPKFDGAPTNSAFATELTADACWESGKIKMWAFGHTHWCCDFERKGVRVYANQRGYGQGREEYDAGRVLDLAASAEGV